ncbi:DUF1311 domain-containing protein [Octadecabacter sp. G9-8]|uniref:DUF1311 domain-containing protein n=1 Tax=Octadecabacter dasysiphoniae TaxID=2909341 RepID=A0ABS9D1D5_9RHOB|nr:lysozyme inhibitor LprI family protein [Octadecabacter dasysiphoniae]MCF2872103.1 DUF1311 domain-containing protein [Octadecabacter dasysiphoniae]
MTNTFSISMAALCLAAILPTASQAEPQPAVLALMPYMDGVAPCLDAATTENVAVACIGEGARICMDGDPDQNQTTLGMVFCLSAEEEAWDRLLNTQYAQTMDGLRRVDADEAELFPEFADRADSLRAAQRAWITLRDADCALEYAMWGAGSMRQIASANCSMTKTAERTIYLKFLGDYMR